MTLDETLRAECEALLLSDALGCSYVHNLALDALLRFAKRQQAVGVRMAAHIAEHYLVLTNEQRRLTASIADTCEAKAKELEA